MATTPLKGLRYPAASDAPDGPGAIYNLALDLDAAIGGSGAVPSSDLNVIVSAGVYFGSGLANAPQGDSGYWWVQAFIAGDALNQVQIAYSLSLKTSWKRYRSGSTWLGWTVIGDDTTILTDTGNYATGFTGNRFNIRRQGSVMTLEMSVTRNGGTITGTAAGNITNVQIGSLSKWYPAMTWAPIASGPGGPNCSFAIDGNGKLWLCAMPPNYNLTNGQELTCGGSFITNAP